MNSGYTYTVTFELFEYLCQKLNQKLLCITPENELFPYNIYLQQLHFYYFVLCGGDGQGQELRYI